MRVHFLLFTALWSSFSFGLTSAELGKRLFFDKRLSADQSVSCATCHRPEKAFTNGLKLAIGAFHRSGERNVPTLLNRNGTHGQFWDMRAPTLEAQVLTVVANPNEMGGDLNGAIERLNADPKYQAQFLEVFKSPATAENLATALANYERTLRAPPAPFDRYMAGDAKAISASAIRGKNLFFGKMNCVSCHSGPNFSDEKLNVRCYPFVANLQAVAGPRFKTPTLRNLKFTGPYMHNGALPTLEATIDFYNPSIQLDAAGKPIPGGNAVYVSPNEKKDLVAFLKSLSAEKPFEEVKD
jgi:cytochrome c peroxidase